MILVILSVAVLIILFVSIVNYYYQTQKYKYSTDAELKKLSVFDKPSTWRICIIISSILFVATFFLCAKYVMGGISDMGTQENSINQYQDDSSNQNTN